MTRNSAQTSSEEQGRRQSHSRRHLRTGFSHSHSGYLNNGFLGALAVIQESVDAVEIELILKEKFGIDFAEIGFDQALIEVWRPSASSFIL